MSESSANDVDLLLRYPLGGPRHACYPPLHRCDSGFREAQLRQAAAESNEDPIPRPLALSVRLPGARAGLRGAPSFDPARIPTYLNRLAREIEMIAPLFDRDRDAVQLHLGGNGPCSLTPDQVGEIMYTLSRQFFFSRSRERDFSIELEASLETAARLARLADLGFNRLRLTPACSSAESTAGASADPLAEVFAAGRRIGFRSIEVMLSNETERESDASAIDSLQGLIAVRPERISLQQGDPATPAIHADRSSASMAGLERQQQMYAMLTAAGYEALGLGHFALSVDDLARARRGQRLQHNALGFCSQSSTDLIGFGVGAISQIAETCSQNLQDLSDWETAIDCGRMPTARGCAASVDEQIRAEVVQALLCRGELDIGLLEERHQIDFALYFQQALLRLTRLQADGVIELQPGRLRIRTRGRPFVAAACAPFVPAGATACELA